MAWRSRAQMELMPGLSLLAGRCVSHTAEKTISFHHDCVVSTSGTNLPHLQGVLALSKVVNNK
jgi:hypothetical protein